MKKFTLAQYCITPDFYFNLYASAWLHWNFIYVIYLSNIGETFTGKALQKICSNSENQFPTSAYYSWLQGL